LKLGHGHLAGFASTRSALPSQRRHGFGRVFKLTKACWRQNGAKGWKYKGSELTPDGGQQLALKECSVAKTQIQFSGRDANLNLRPDLSQLVQPITIQIQQSDGTCWSAVY